MVEIELLQIEPNAREVELAERLQVPDSVLTFNARSVESIMVCVAATASSSLAASFAQPASEGRTDRMSLAAYHPEEQALYFKMSFFLPMPTSLSEPEQVSVGCMVRAGPSPGDIEIETVGARTCEMILEFMDCVDLSRVSLPHHEYWPSTRTENTAER